MKALQQFVLMALFVSNSKKKQRIKQQNYRILPSLVLANFKAAFKSRALEGFLDASNLDLYCILRFTSMTLIVVVSEKPFSIRSPLS